VTRLNWKFVHVCLEIVLILTQQRYTICAKHTIDLEIIWTHPIEVLGDVGHMEVLVRLEIVLVSMQDWCTVCAKRALGSEIFLDTSDGTPR
jgi:hypothetical protein